MTAGCGLPVDGAITRGKTNGVAAASKVIVKTIFPEVCIKTSA